MKTTLSVLFIVMAAAASVSAFQLAPQAAPPQQPEPIEFNNPAVLDSIIQPYVQMARRTYPEAKARFLKGLPSSQKFLITIRAYDQQGNFEQIFVEVHRIENGQVKGMVSTSSGNLPGLAPGDRVACPEEEVLDWCILQPDGTQEGNLVGKFLDVVRERIVGLVMELVITKDGSVSKAKCVRALNRAQQDVSFCIPDTVFHMAETMAREIKYDPMDSVVTKFTYIVYDYVGRSLQAPNVDQRKKVGEAKP
jgi:hypothetical protein